MRTGSCCQGSCVAASLTASHRSHRICTANPDSLNGKKSTFLDSASNTLVQTSTKFFSRRLGESGFAVPHSVTSVQCGRTRGLHEQLHVTHTNSPRRGGSPRRQWDGNCRQREDCDQASACSMSARRSSVSSTPHESRMRPSLKPISFFRSAGTDACVIDAG
jgi:hypothetical protein